MQRGVRVERLFILLRPSFAVEDSSADHAEELLEPLLLQCVHVVARHEDRTRLVGLQKPETEEDNTDEKLVHVLRHAGEGRCVPPALHAATPDGLGFVLWIGAAVGIAAHQVRSSSPADDFHLARRVAATLALLSWRDIAQTGPRHGLADAAVDQVEDTASGLFFARPKRDLVVRIPDLIDDIRTFQVVTEHTGSDRSGHDARTSLP